MRRTLKKKKINDKLGKVLFNCLVRMQQIILKNKIEPTQFNLVFSKILLLISGLQEIQLITSTDIQNYSSVQIQSSLLSLLQKFTINLIKYERDELFLLLLLSIEVIYFLAVMIVYFDKKEKFILVGQFYKYFQNIFHQIIFLPTLNISFNFAISQNYLEVSIIGIILGLFLEIIYCFCNIKNNLIEIEGCYSQRLANLFQLLMQFIICFVVQNNYSYQVAPTLLLFSRLIMITQRINSYQYNSWYYLKITNFVISYIVVLLTNQYWYDLVLLYILFISFQISIRQKRLGEELFSKNSQSNLFKYSIYRNLELVKNFMSYSHFFITIQEQSILKYQRHALKDGNIPEKLTVLQNVFKYKKIQLYLNLINIERTNLSYLQQLTLEANLLNVIQSCEKLITSPLNVNLYIKTLILEQQNFQLLINFIDLKSQFYILLAKEQAMDQYLKSFRIQLNKILDTLEIYKNKFEKQYDLQSGRLLEFKNSDQISINIVSSFLFVFYSNYQKVKELQKKQSDLLLYDKIMNMKFQKNEAFLLSSSFIKDSNNIINKNNKRLLQILGGQMEPKQLIELLPQFQKTVYNSFVNQYLYQGLDINQPLTLYFYKNEYLVECNLYIYVTISKDDIILQNLLVLKNQPNHFAIFDSEGKILGISQQIYEFLISKCDNAFTKKLVVSEFIQSGMIQYYLPEIYSHIQELTAQYSLGTFQQTVNISSRWQFPVNHKKCLEQTQALGLVNDEGTISSQFKKIFYSSSTKRLVSTKQHKLTEEMPIIKNVKIKIMQKQIMNQIQALVVPPSRMKSIDFEGSLEFVQQKYIESETNYFVLRFKQIEEFQQEKITQIAQIEDIQNLSLIINEQQFEGLQSDYEFISNLIKSKKLYTPLKYNIWILILMILVTTIALVVSYQLNYANMINYQNDVNFLNTPQAMTFNIGASFMLMWNQYCIENKLYNISPFLEYKRQNQLIYVFDFWGSVHQEYSMNLSRKSIQLGFDTIDLITYQNDIKTQQQLNYYEFYAIIREAMVRQFKKTDFKNISTFDPDILKTNGIIRQNMLKIYKFHNFILDEVIKSTEDSFTQFEDRTFIFCVYSSIIILILLVVFFIINCRLLRTETKLIRLLQYLNIKIIQEQLDVLNYQKEQLQKLLLNQIQSKDELLVIKQSEKVITNQPKNNPLSKLEHYSEKYTLLIILSLVIGVELILFIFGSQLVSKLYNSQYQSSLILTMKYLKLKSRLDSAVIVGEVIKTEHLILNNTSIEYINQTDHIEFFFNNIDVLLNLSDQINNELVITTSYNQTFKKQLIDIFNDDLCTYYSSILSFCKIENIQKEYYESENYLTLIDKGIYGIIQDLNKLSKQEFNFEQVNQLYEYDQSHSDYFLKLPIHGHLFLQYFIELQTCIYFCFLDIFTETQILSNKLSNQILIYLISSSVAQIFLIIQISYLYFICIRFLDQQIVQQNKSIKINCYFVSTCFNLIKSIQQIVVLPTNTDQMKFQYLCFNFNIKTYLNQNKMINKILLKTYKQLQTISKHYFLTFNEMVFERNQDHILQIIIVQIFIILHELQQIELSNNSNFNYLILEIPKRYRINFLLPQNSSSVFYVMATIIITFFVFINILTICYMKKLIQSNSIIYFVMFINHYLLFIPIFFGGFQNLSLQSINEVSIICMILSLTIEVLNITFNTKLYFIETQGAYFLTLIHSIIMFFNISFCLIKVIVPQSTLIIQIIQIILKIIYCFIIIEKQDHNTTFQLSIQIIIIIQILLNPLKLDWCQMMIYFILGITLTIAIRQKIIFFYILDNNQVSLLKFQIHNLVQSNKKKKIIEILIESQIKQANLNIFQIINNFQNFDEKIQYIDFLKDKNCMQGLLLLSKIKSDQFSFLQKIKLQTLKKIFNTHCHRYYNQQEDIKLATKVLIVEEKVIMILNKISRIKIDFLLQLKSDQEEQAYINSILKNLHKTTKELQNYKNQFENLIDLNQLKMKFLQKSDILTIKHIANFYQNFYLDLEKASQIKSRMIDKIQWNKILNLQIEACQCLVIQISYQKEFGKIYNLNTQRLKQIFPNLKIIPQNMTDLLPLFWKDSYFKLIQSYLESSQNSKNIIIGVLKNEQFIQPCQFYISYQLADDDIIINQFIIIEKLTPQTLWFNSDGQILGVSKEIYEHLILKSENAYTQQLKINEFLENAMIQFYISEIYSQVLQFQNLTLQNQFTLKASTQWKFPLNHKKCFERVKQFYQEEIQLNSRKSLQQIFYSQSTKNMFNNFKSKVTIAQATDPKIQNIPIKMIKPNYQEQISKLVISSKSISIDIEYELCFLKYEQIEGDWIVLFSINFLGVEGLKSHISQDQYIQQGLNNLITNIQQYNQQNNLEQSQIQGEDLINHKGSYKHIKISLFLLFIVSIILIVLSYFNISTNQKDIKIFEYYYDYAIYPQAITFVYAALYLNQWNRLCQINNIYNLSEFVENSRLGSLEFVNGIFLVRYNQDAMGSYLLSLDINQEKIIVDFYNNNTLEKDELDYLQFFDVARTKMDKMHRENLINYKTPLEDYSTLNSSSFIRQNVIKIFVFCDVAMEALVQIVLDKIEQSTQQFNIILIVECSLALIIILVQSKTMIGSSEIKNNIFQLLTHLSHDTINDTTQNQTTINNQQQIHLTTKLKSTVQINHKLTNHKYQSLKSFILPLSYFVIFITLSLSVSFLHLEYYSQYKQSLRTTFQFVKLKKIFDSSVLLGELIKTEYLINSDSLKYINQTEIISQFFNYTDQLLPIINNIMDEVIENDIFNSSTQEIILTALQGNLCENFPKFYHFCNISSDLNHTDKDITYLYLTQGISGMMQKYQNLLQSEFSQERDSLQYQTNKTLLQEYLDSQIHQNIFIQYFYDMEYLVFTSFNYFYEQTMTIGQEVKDKLSNFFLYSGLISLAIISIEFLIWYYIEDQEFSQLKLIITLLPQSLLKNKNISRLVLRTFTQIY